MKKAFLTLMVGLFIATNGFAQATEAPDVLVKRVANEVLDIIKNDKDIKAGNHKKLRDLVEKKVLPNFNFERMTASAIGKHWEKTSAEQKKSLITEFRSLLVLTYSNSLGMYKDETIDYMPLKFNPADKEVDVKTRVNQRGGEAIPIIYSMESTAEGWRIYNVQIGGISLLTNYRNSFNSEIQKSGVDGLIKILADKNKNLGKKS